MINPEKRGDNQENIEDQLNEFKEEIAEIKRQEEEGNLSTVHLAKTDYKETVNVDELTEEDMRIWQKLKDGTLTKEEFQEYKAKVPRDNQSRVDFMAFIANKLSIITLKEYFKEKKDK